MSRAHTLVRIVTTVAKDPRTLKRVLDDDALSHDQLYGERYFRMVEETTVASREVIARSIVETFAPATVADVGCGTGALLDELRRAGVGTVKGLEYAEAGLRRCQERGLDVVAFDIEIDTLPDGFGVADVVVSMEVGHQLRPTAADRYVDLLTSLAPVVVFSSAVPGQGDRHPRNSQPHSYWRAAFEARGYELDPTTTSTWRGQWLDADIAPWFSQNLLVFTRT